MVKLTKILITGGTGYVGAAVAKNLAMKGYHSIAYDNVFREIDLPAKASGNIKYITGDITDLSHLVEICDKEDIVGIIHLAAAKRESFCKEFPSVAYRINVQGTHNVLEVARLKKLRRVVMVSTGAVFGEWSDPNISIKEEDPVSPIGMYANMKYAAERLVHAYSDVFGLSAAIVRISRVYGPGTRVPKLEYGTGPIPVLLSKALQSNLVKEETGADYMANFSYIKDVAKGIGLAYLKEDKGCCLFHIGSDENYSVLEIAEALMKVLPGIKIEVGPGSAPYDQQAPVRGPFSIELAKKVLGFNPEYSLERGIKELVEWIKSTDKISSRQ